MYHSGRTKKITVCLHSTMQKELFSYGVHKLRNDLFTDKIKVFLNSKRVYIVSDAIVTKRSRQHKTTVANQQIKY